MQVSSVVLSYVKFVFCVSGWSEEESGEPREHIDEREWAVVGRGYDDRMYEWLKLGVFQEKVKEIKRFIPAVEENILSKDEGEAARAELAAGEGKAS